MAKRKKKKDKRANNDLQNMHIKHVLGKVLVIPGKKREQHYIYARTISKVFIILKEHVTFYFLLHTLLDVGGGGVDRGGGGLNELGSWIT